jgi:hypothetical protein
LEKKNGVVNSALEAGGVALHSSTITRGYTVIVAFKTSIKNESIVNYFMMRTK